MLTKLFIHIHRILGLILCILCFSWFISGIVMIYHSFPRVSQEDRFTRAEILDTNGLPAIQDVLLRLPAKTPTHGLSLNNPGVPIERLPGWIPYAPSTSGYPSPITSGNFPSTNSTSTVRKNTSFTSLPEPPISCSLPIPTIVSGHGVGPFPIGCISPLSEVTRTYGHNSCTGHVISECSCVLPDSFSAYVPTGSLAEKAFSALHTRNSGSNGTTSRVSFSVYLSSRGY